MDVEFIKWLTTLGVGGVLAAVVFSFYRKDVKQFTELWQLQTGLLMKVVTENTAAFASHRAVTEALHRRLDAFDDTPFARRKQPREHGTT